MRSFSEEAGYPCHICKTQHSSFYSHFYETQPKSETLPGYEPRCPLSSPPMTLCGDTFGISGIKQEVVGGCKSGGGLKVAAGTMA